MRTSTSVHWPLFLFLGLLAASLPISHSHAQTADDLVAYQAATPFKAFLEPDVRVVSPGAVIVRPGDFVRVGDRYLVRKDAARDKAELFLEVVAEWIEPVRAPQNPGEIRVALVAGTVEAAPPTDPAKFSPVTVGTVLPAGSTLRCGPDSQAGVTIGERSAARFIAGSVGTLSLEAPAGTGVEKVRINLKSGAVFNKIRSFNKNVDYQVQTPQAIAAARGTDFVAVALPTVTDVWIAEGTVELMDTTGKSVGTVSAEEAGALKIIRYPQTPEPVANAEANSLTMSVAMSLIPQLNQNTSALRARENLNAEDFGYLQGVHRVTYLVRATKPQP
ncbi:MAG: FecR family protein [Candidatus Methylacidiphilales bacterium]|nr:FecR family protein [Candidatus Methylacidiphilales bacterium]